MNPSRNGKIARLPRSLREELNRRLDHGEPGAPLVAWLNTLPEVQTVLAAHFAGSPINEQNLSAWKQGGFADWLRREEAREWVGRLVEDSDLLQEESGSQRLADRVAIPLLLELVALLQEARTLESPAERRQAVLGLAQQLTQLRRADRQAERMQMEKEHWEFKRQDLRRKRRSDDAWDEGVKQIQADLFPKVTKENLSGQNAIGLKDWILCRAAAAQLQRQAAGETEPSPSTPPPAKDEASRPPTERRPTHPKNQSHPKGKSKPTKNRPPKGKVPRDESRSIKANQDRKKQNASGDEPASVTEH